MIGVYLHNNRLFLFAQSEYSVILMGYLYFRPNIQPLVLLLTAFSNEEAELAN